MNLQLSLLLNTLFSDDDDSLTTARSHWIRRPGRPQGDLPHLIIPSEIAKLILAADPNSVYTHVQTVSANPPYHVLWTASYWAESNERRYQSRITNAKFVTNFYDKIHYDNCVQGRYWLIAGNFAKFFGMKQSLMLDYVMKIWKDSDESEAKFKQALANIEGPLGIILYINPPVLAQQKEDSEQTAKNTNTEPNKVEEVIEVSKLDHDQGCEGASYPTEQTVDAGEEAQEGDGRDVNCVRES